MLLPKSTLSCTACGIMHYRQNMTIKFSSLSYNHIFGPACFYIERNISSTFREVIIKQLCEIQMRRHSIFLNSSG